MDASGIAIILSSVGVSGIVAALINSYANRKKVGADATQIITDAAGSIVATVRKELEEVQEALAEERRWREEVTRMLREHEPWDHAAVRAVNSAVPPIDLPPPPPLVPGRRTT